MFFRARRYIVAEGKADAFTAFFLQRMLPIEERYGGRLVGRWQTEDESEVLALWAYQSREAAEQCAKSVGEDPASREAASFRALPRPALPRGGGVRPVLDRFAAGDVARAVRR